LFFGRKQKVLVIKGLKRSLLLYERALQDRLEGNTLCQRHTRNPRNRTQNTSQYSKILSKPSKAFPIRNPQPNQIQKQKTNPKQTQKIRGRETYLLASEKTKKRRKTALTTAFT
jgi:hypothetical protein